MSKYWCMRYEAKHSYFKDVAQKTKCFKNIPKSLAERHQSLLCYKFFTSNVLLKEMKVSKSKLYVINTAVYRYVLLCMNISVVLVNYN